MQREGGCAVVRQAHIIAAVGVLLMGCTILLVVGCAGVRSQAPQKEEQARSDRCEGTRTFKPKGSSYLSTTNDLPGCPNKGGLLSGTDKADDLDGKDGDDEIHGLGGYEDFIDGGLGNDVIYGGPGTDYMGGDEGDDVLYGDDGPDFLWGDKGEDVLYGGKGNDWLDGTDGSPMRDELWSPMRDELYCGPGKDQYAADRLDYVDSSCEEKVKPNPGGGGGA
jgi:Ca2+-binding RTX toxin-like protein